MGTVTIEKAGQLYWLGRYVERVYSTLKAFNDCHDAIIDINEDSYVDFCKKLAIPNIYSDHLDFIGRYLYDSSDPNSIYSNLSRAYDNAIIVRNIISSDTMSYIQMALDFLADKSKNISSPHLGNLKVIDYLLAFWGSVDDYVADEECRNIIKTGKYIERLDLYIRLDQKYEEIEKECRKLENRIAKTSLPYSKSAFARFKELVNGRENWERSRPEALICVESIFAAV